MSDGRLQFAHTLRGIAALCVVVMHYCIGYWQPAGRSDVAWLINAPELPAAIGIPPALQFLQTTPWFSLGQFGVALFFLISGFVIPFSLRGSTTGSFLIGRVFRLLPVYAVGFSISLLAILAASTYFGRPWPLRLDQVMIHYLPGLRDLLQSRNIDGIVWTLEIEVKFYLLCALLAPLLRRLSLWLFAAPLLIALAVTTLGLADISAPTVLVAGPSLVFMFVGTAIYYLHAGRLSAREAAGLALLLFVVFGFVLLVASGPSVIAAISYGLAALVFAAAYAARAAFTGDRLTSFLADISYPLYVVHGLAGFAILRIGADLGISPLLSIAFALAFAIGAASVIHRLVEIPAQRFGKALGRRLRSGLPATPPPIDAPVA